jgi:chemosensory pili system protein ChpA (sensor histidine kinase/response regulator)
LVFKVELGLLNSYFKLICNGRSFKRKTMTQTEPQTQPHNSELMDAFLEDSWDALAHLDAARVRLSQDHSPAALEELRILSHRMRGTSAIYGYPQFARLAALSERMMEAGQHFIAEDYPDLDVFLDQFSACARAAVERIAFGKGEGQVGLEFSSLGAANIVQGLINKHPKAFLLAPSPKSVGYSEIPLESGLNVQLQTFFNENAETWEYFAPEAKEHLEIIHSLLERGGEAESEETIVQLFRSTHTLKGSAYMVGFAPMGLLAHRLEDVMSAVRDGGRPYTPEIAEALAMGNETLSQMLEVAEGHTQPLETSLEASIEALEGLLGAEPMQELKELLASSHAPALNPSQAAHASTQLRVAGQLEQFFEEHMEIWGEFSGELRQHLEQLRELFLAEGNLDLAAFLRSLHGLKGETTALNYPIFSELTIQLEAVLIEVREGQIDLDEPIVQLAESALETLERIILTSEGVYPAADLEQNLTVIHAQLAALLGEQPQAIALPTGVAVSTPQRAANRSIRVNLDKLDNLMNVVGEMVNLRARFTRQTSQILGVGQLLETSRSRMLRTIAEFETKYLNPRLAAITPAKTTPNPNNPNSPNNPSSTLQTVSEMFNELEFDTYSDLNILARSVIEMADDLGEVSTLLQSQLAGVRDETENLQKLSRRLRDEVSSARMVPLSNLYSRLRRLVKEGAAGKTFQFEVSGETVEIDNYILEEIADPLLHLLKNSIYHGIEGREERIAKGKPASGTIRIRAYPQGNNVMLEVEDDGKGIQLERVKQKALERKLFDAQTLEEMSEEDAVQLIFSAGLSTADLVTLDAGRGVGMDAVAAGIRRLNGEISVQTEQDFGTIFTLKLPLTLVVSEALLVECAGQTLAFPALAVRSLRNLERFQIQSLESSAGVSSMTFLEQQEQYRLYSLAALLGLPDASVNAPECLVVILDTGSEQFGLIVDGFVGLEEVVQKPLSEALRGLSHLAGATVASSGEVILILDPQGTVRLGNERFVQRSDDQPLRPFEAKIEQRLLLVDDSVSVRRIVSKMLTRAGYQVVSAVDGQEALEMLRQDQNFTAVLSDLEMPRMNGYELIESMKAREELRDLPVVVMTTRAGEKHRDLAFRLGASEYFSKPIEEAKLLGFLGRLNKITKAS